MRLRTSTAVAGTPAGQRGRGRLPRSRWALPLPAVLLALSLGAAGGDAAARTPAGGSARASAASAAAMPIQPCIDASACEPVIGTGAGMAVPLIKPWLRGNDGGWDQFTLCCTQINPGRLGSVSGLLNDHPAVVVPGGGTEIVGLRVSGGATSAVVYGISGPYYRYARFVSGTSRGHQSDPELNPWTVSSDVYSWACQQRGARRDPATDCGNGVHQYTRGQADVTPPADPRAYAVVLPINYYARVVDSRGRPLANPYRRSTGHWLLRAQAQYHGWLWTVEWTVAGVGVGRVAGSSFISGSRIVLTDGPFN